MADYINMDIRKASGLDAKTLQSRIDPSLPHNEQRYGRPSGGSKMRGIAELMLKMEFEYGLNAAFLCALMAWETGWGCNDYAYNYNSFFSYGAFDSNPDGTIKNGGSTVLEGLRNGVSAIRSDFVDYKKLYTIKQFTTAPYATDPNWAEGVASIWAKLQGDTNTGSLLIPQGEGRSNKAWNPLVGRQWDWYLYTLEKGDSVASVAKRFGQTVEFINKWNGLKPNSTLQPGWKLRVYPFYVTQIGDTMSAITNDFSVTSAEIHKLNPSLSNLVDGQAIRLPNSVIDDLPPTSYEQINLQTPTASDRYKRKLPLQPVVGSAPHVEDDEYPAHRTRQNPYSVRIGDVQLFIPPTSIKTKKDSFVSHKPVMRTQNGMMTRSGHTKHIIELTLYFADTDQINGYRVKGPNGQTYYMDGLRPLIAQFMKNPFLPIRNELLNDRYHVYNVAFQDLTIETDPDFDNVLVATLKLIECTVEPFIQYPDFYYDSLFMYPLFRWWYQQMLLDDPSQRLSSRYLAKVPDGTLRGGIKFKVLDRDLVDDLISNTNYYQLSQMKLPELESLMTEWDVGGAVLQKVTLGISKDLQPIYLDHHEMPAFQDLGGMNKEFLLEFLCTDRSQLESFNNMVTHLEEMSRDYRHRFVSGYLKVTNELVNMMGVYNAMVISMDTATLSEHDEQYIVRLFCRGFDATQKNNERIMGVNSIMDNVNDMFSFSNQADILIEDKTHRFNGIMLESAIEEALNFIELYPDLELPTYDDLNKAVVAINKFRRSRGRATLPVDKIVRPPQSVYVDPDFYFAYPDIKKAFDSLSIGEFGERIVNLMASDSKSFIDSVMASNQMDLNWWLDGTDPDLHGWNDDKFAKTIPKPTTTKVNIDFTEGEHVISTIGKNWGTDLPVPSDDAILDLMCVDMGVYNRRGRMVRAFPSFLLMFIDEGQWLNGKRIWNNYYTYHAIQDLSVVKDKNQPVDLAYIRLTNIYGAFDLSTKMSDPREFMTQSKGIVDRVLQLFKNFTLTIDDKIIQERTQLIDHLKLRQGARVHIRMGYGATASYLPISFNGQIATINDNDELEIVCQGDGVELTRTISLDTSGKLTNGQDLAEEPQNVFRQILCSRQNDFWFETSEVGNLFKNISSAFGIEHFGYLESKANNGFWGSPKDIAKYVLEQFLPDDIYNAEWMRMEYDIMKNIFRGNKWDAMTGNEDSSFVVFDGEVNVNLNPFNKTAWDIMQTITLHTAEFICGIHPHGFRSTLFHGMPHWPVKYGYRRKKDANGKPVGDPMDPSSYEELYKTYQQFHVLASGYDIVHNNIQVSSELIKHIAVGVYTKSRSADMTNTFPVYADRTIKQEIQKTMIVDTMVHQNLWGFEWGYDLIHAGFGWINDLFAWAGESTTDSVIDKALGQGRISKEDAEYLRRRFYEEIADEVGKDRMWKPGFEQALAITIGSLQRQFMEMYQGELIVLGQGSLKPWDIFFLSDEYKMMMGTAGVGKVTHTISYQTGFMTIIKPDLQVTRVDGVQRNWLMAAITRAGTYTAGIMVRRMMMTKAAKMIARVTGGATLWTARVAGRLGLATASFAVGDDAVRLATQAINDSNIVTKGLSALKNAGKLGSKVLKLVKVNFVVGVILNTLTTWVEQWFRKEFGYNNCIFIYPLWKAGKPYVAGITGYRYIIPNYIEPEWLPLDHIKEIDIGDPTPANRSARQRSEFYGGLPPGSVVKPVSTLVVTSPFGMRNGKMHWGIDLAPLEPHKFTTKVVSIADGKITAHGYHSEMGNYVECQYRINGKDYHVTYMHLHMRADPDLPQTMDIAAGDMIGIMGNTGRVMSGGKLVDDAGRARGLGTHLHLEIREGTSRAGKAIDPEKFFREMQWTYEKR